MKIRKYLYSFLHFAVDCMCAYAIYAKYVGIEGKNIMSGLIIYNVCAFALQLPIGIFSDILLKKKIVRRVDDEIYMYALLILGVIITMAGIHTNVIVLGIGNALFHVGGGMYALYVDQAEKAHGMELGVFIAPGAIGLFLGKYISEFDNSWKYVLALILISVFICIIDGIFKVTKEKKEIEVKRRLVKKWIIDHSFQINDEIFIRNKVIILLFCFLIVIIRSYIGLEIVFSWRDTAIESLLVVACVFVGKILGGICSFYFTEKKTMLFSFLIAAVLFIFSDIPLIGCLALVFFNMSMPVTLELVARSCGGKNGTAFGFLSFGLFVGALPVLLKCVPPTEISGYIASYGSAFSFILMAIIFIKTENARKKGNVKREKEGV